MLIINNASKIWGSHSGSYEEYIPEESTINTVTCISDWDGVRIGYSIY
jgi:hypothetical protein